MEHPNNHAIDQHRGSAIEVTRDNPLGLDLSPDGVPFEAASELILRLDWVGFYGSSQCCTASSEEHRRAWRRVDNAAIRAIALLKPSLSGWIATGEDVPDDAPLAQVMAELATIAQATKPTGLGVQLIQILLAINDLTDAVREAEAQR